MHKKFQRLIFTSLTIGMAGVLCLSPQTAYAAAVDPSISRLSGVDQYETAFKIAEQGWTGTVDSVVLASGMTPNLVDALAAGPLCAKLDSPLILTDGGDQLNAWAKQELIRLKPSQVFLTSGTAVLKPSVLEELKGMGITPIELGGYDQYETSVNIAQEMIRQGVQVSEVVLAAGWMDPADALSIAPIAAAQGMPILATTPDGLPPSVKVFLAGLSGVNDSYVIGGTAVVGDIVQAQLPGITHRYAGLTKYDTNIEVLKRFKYALDNEKIYVANGETLVDALAGVPLAARTSSAILLTTQKLAPSSGDYMNLNLPAEFIALGGQAVVPQSVIDLLASPLPGYTPPPGGGGVVIPPTVTVRDIRVLTVPSLSLGSYLNGGTVDLSSAPDTTQVTGFSITVDKACDLQLDGLEAPIPLLGGQATLVYLDDIISGTQGGNGISLKTFRGYFGSSVIIQGKLKKNASVVGNLSLTLKL